MASYEYNVLAQYDLADPSLGFVEKFIDTSDGAVLVNIGETFNHDDTLNTGGFDGPGPGSVTFYGTIEIGDVTLIVTVLLNETYFVYAKVDLPDSYVFPASIAIGDVSTAEFTPCFLAGVQIATPSGSVAVERLAIGDLVLTADWRAVPVKWVGKRSVVTVFGPPAERWPVVVGAGALGEGLPSADLRVTADHALLLDGVLVQAGALVNGTTIRRMTSAELGDHYVVYHVETEGHEIIVADGMPAETFVDNVTRCRFDNHGEYAAIYGDADASIAELALPRIKSARQLPQAIRRRLGNPARRSGRHADASTAA